MATTLGEATVPIRATLDKLDKDLAGAKGKINKAVESLKTTATKIGKAAFIGATAAIVGLGAIAIKTGSEMVSMGADANETASLLDTSLGPAAENLNSTLRDFAEQANRSFYELQAGSSTFVAMTRSMGATQDEAANLGVSFTEMATDLGSFFNQPTENALLDIQSALAGSSETMTKYGIDIRETTLKQMALDQGLIESASQTLPQLVRAQLIEQAILQQGADAMGDAIRTSDSWQNTMRGLTGRLKDVATETGQKLIPALTPMLTLVGDLAERAVPYLSSALDAIIPIIEDISSFFTGFFAELEKGNSIWDAAVEALLNWTDVGEANFDAILNIVTAIEDFMATVREAIQPIIDTINQYVEWQDVAIGLAIAIGSIVIPIIWGIISPVLAVIAAVAAIIAVVSLVRNAWENDWGGIRTYLTDTWENKIQPALQALGDWIVNILIPKVQELWDTWVNVVWPAIKSAMAAAWAFLQPILAALGDWIMGTLIPQIQNLWNTWVNVVWPAIKDAMAAAWAFIQPILAALGDWIINTLIPQVVELYTQWTEVWWPTIQTVLENVWTVIMAIWTELGRWINDNIIPWVEYLQEVWTENVWPAIQAVLETVWGILEPIFEELGGWLSETIPTALQGLQDVWESVMGRLDSAVSPIKAAIDGLKSAAESFWNWLSSHVFSFQIHIPDLPDWAVPGSPLPIHTAWKNFADDLNRMVIRPQIELGDGSGRGDTIFQLTAQYAYQEERSLRDDIRLLQMMADL